MAYERGDLYRVGRPSLEGYSGEDEDGNYAPSDARGGYERLSMGVYLPHSCGSWVIGGVEQIRLLIKDLQDALVWLEEKEKEKEKEREAADGPR